MKVIILASSLFAWIIGTGLMIPWMLQHIWLGLPENACYLASMLSFILSLTLSIGAIALKLNKDAKND